MTTPLPCPFCGSTKVTVEWEPCPTQAPTDTNRRWFAECTQCSCQGPFCQKEPEVMVKWNTRKRDALLYRLGNALREQNERWGLYGDESQRALKAFEELGGEMSATKGDSNPPTDPKPGDTWGAYRFHEDGWWRLENTRKGDELLRHVWNHMHGQNESSGEVKK